MQKRKTMGELRPLAPLLGKTEGEARAWVTETAPASPVHSWVTLSMLRVIREDGVGQNAFCDQRLGRVNVELEDGVVSKVVGTG